MVKEALKNLKLNVMLKYTMKIYEMQEKVSVSVIDLNSSISDLGSDIMLMEARLSKIEQELQTESNPARIAELREEEKKLGLSLTETKKKQSREKRKLQILGKLDKFVAKMDDRKFEKGQVLYEKLKRENEENFKRTSEYNKLLGGSATVAASDLGEDGLMREVPEDSFSKACDEFMAILQSSEEPTFDQMCENLLRAYEKGTEAFNEEMKKGYRSDRNFANETSKVNGSVMMDAPAAETPVVKKDEKTLASETPATEVPAVENPVLKKSREIPANKASSVEKPKTEQLKDESTQDIGDLEMQ